MAADADRLGDTEGARAAALARRRHADPARPCHPLPRRQPLHNCSASAARARANCWPTTATRAPSPGSTIVTASMRRPRAADHQGQPPVQGPPPRAARPVHRAPRRGRARRRPCRSMPACGPAPRSLTPPGEVPVLRRQLATLMELFGFAAGEPRRQGAGARADRAAARPGDRFRRPRYRARGDRDDGAGRPPAAARRRWSWRRSRATVRLRLAAARHALDRGAAADPGTCSESETQADTLDWSLVVEGGNLAMLRYVLDFRGTSASPDEAAIDRRLQHMLRGWSEAVEAELEQSENRPRRRARGALSPKAFPHRLPRHLRPGRSSARHRPHRATFPRATPIGPRGRDARLYRLDSDDACQLRLKIYQHGGSLPLSDAVPALENFGFRVLAEVPTELEQRRTRHDPRFPSVPAARRRGRRGVRTRRDDRGGDRRGAQRPGRGRRVQPAGRRHRARCARGRLAARALSLSAPAATRLHHLHRGRRAAPRARGHARPDRPAARAPRPGLRGRPRRGRSGGDRRGDPQRPGRGRGDRRRPHAAALLARRSRRSCGPTPSPRRRARRWRSSSIQRSFPACPSRCRGARSGSIRRASRASICAPARSRAAACAGPTGATISAPRSSA